MKIHKRTYIAILSWFIFCFFAQAQDYSITFSATGESTTIDSIKINNITQNTSIKLLGHESLRLLQTTTGLYEQSNNPEWIKVYPNPMTHQANLEFFSPESDIVNIEIFNISGLRVASKTVRIDAGKSTFQISGVIAGTYLINVSSNVKNYCTKIISKGNGSSVPHIHHITSNKSYLKTASVDNIVEMQYNDGDILKFIAYSGEELTDTIETVLTEDTQVAFVFEKLNESLVITVYDATTWSPENPTAPVVENAIVELYVTSNSQLQEPPLKTTTTNQYGKATFFDLPEGNYGLLVGKGDLSNLINGYLIIGVFQNQEETDASPDHSAIYRGGARPGDIKLADINGDNYINSNDKVNYDGIRVEDSGTVIKKDVYIGK